MNSVAVIIVHFGDYALTRACIESVLLSSEDVHIVVCDNSMNISNDTLRKDFEHIAISDINKSDAVGNNKLLWHKMLFNSGYAAAANAGIRLAQKYFSSDYFLILNNDCTIEQACIEKLMRCYQSIIDCGLLGAKVLFRDNDIFINSVGGYFNAWTGWQKNIGAREKDSGQYIGLLQPDYVYGACMFFSKAFINQVGLMDEHFLLYHEEHDWCVRAVKKGFNNYTCCDAVVYHQQGASSGKKIKHLDAPEFILILQYSNLIRFYLKHYPLLLPIAYFRLLLIMLKRMLQGKFKHSLLLLSVIFGKRIHTLPAL